MLPIGSQYVTETAAIGKTKTRSARAALAAGVTDHVWGLEEIVGLLDAAGKKAA